jgi:hypothetical protein
VRRAADALALVAMLAAAIVLADQMVTAAANPAAVLLIRE